MPAASQSSFQEVADALNGAPEALGCNVVPTESLLQKAVKPASVVAATDIFVDPVAGSDSDPGTQQAPVKTIGKVRCAQVPDVAWRL